MERDLVRSKNYVKGSLPMTHYVLLKLAPGADRDKVFERVKKTYAELDGALSYLNDARVYLSCIDRDTNADIMAVVELDGPECLKPYLTHPLHLAMANDLKDALSGRTSFDHM